MSKIKFFDPYENKLTEYPLDRPEMADIFSKYFPFKDELDFDGKRSKTSYYDVLEEKMISDGETQNFAFHYDGDTWCCFFVDKNTNVQITWYKLGHIGRCNTVSKNGKDIKFTMNDWEDFCRRIRIDLDKEIIHSGQIK